MPGNIAGDFNAITAVETDIYHHSLSDESTCVDGTLQVYRGGRQLIDTVDYQFDPFTGKLELLFYPETDLQLDVKYDYAVSEVLGNRFLALSDSFSLGQHTAGFAFFGSPFQRKSEPILLGEVKQPE